MRDSTIRFRLLLALGAVLLAAPSKAAPADVTYATRVDDKNQIYVDVENSNRVGIRVTSVVVAFYDRRKLLIERNTVDCRTDCSVGAADVESFGPLDGPSGWDTVKIVNVFYAEGSEKDVTDVEPLVPTVTPGTPPKSTLPPSLPLPAVVIDGRTESLDGYAEWWKDGQLIVDGQRVRLGASGKLKSSKEIKGFSSIPLGYEVKVKGHRVPGGALEADEVMVKENGTALFEQDLRKAFDDMERKYVADRRMYEEDDNGKREDYGRLYTSGPQVDRVRGILKRLVPGYLENRDFRIYVVENKEWNAMAAPNDSMYVFSGLLADMDDDEVAIVLGHELAHATHEHSRKSFKKSMLIQLAAVGVVAVTEEAVKGKNTRAVLQVATLLGASAWTNGYGRSHEDQADRVGMRYAAEGGFDVNKGPRLWNRFAEKYGNSPKALNFFFGDHSVAQDRSRNLSREIALNYSR